MEKRWKQIKEHRDGFYATYNPATKFNYLAAAHITYVDQVPPKEQVKRDLENEARLWIEAFPAPTFLTAIDKEHDRIELEESIDSYLVAFPENKEIKYFWGGCEDSGVPEHLKTTEHRCKIYKDVDFVSDEEIEANILKQRQTVKSAKVLVFFIDVIFPVLKAVFGYLTGVILGLLELFLAIGKAFFRFGRLLGFVDEFEYEKKKREENGEKEHHHCHCKMNPEGFQRLVRENHRRMNIENTLKESEELKNKSSNKALGENSEPLRDSESSS